jgi:hypothetical protein
MLERKQPRVLRDPSQRYPSGLDPISSRARWSVFDVNDSSVSTNSMPARAHFARRASISLPWGMKLKIWFCFLPRLPPASNSCFVQPRSERSLWQRSR